MKLAAFEPVQCVFHPINEMCKHNYTTDWLFERGCQSSLFQIQIFEFFQRFFS